jgi:hypothetical protein
MAGVAVTFLTVYLQRRDLRELDRARAMLIRAVEVQRASLTPGGAERLAVVESWLAHLSGAYEGDFVAGELRAPGGLAEVLGRQAVYVRGPLVDFRIASGIADAAAASSVDAFVTCLVDPPASRSEKSALVKVQAASSFAGNVYRLEDARVISPILSPPWLQRIGRAADQDSLGALRREFDRAPFERGKKALAAELLVVVMDEPAAGGSPTELDGERPHDVRVAMVDLAKATVLLRTKKHLDPSWISEAKRPVFAAALDACVLAIDVRELASGPLAKLPAAR